MAENVDHILIEQLRLIRDDLKRMDARFDALDDRLTEEIGDVKVQLQAVEGVLFGLGGYIRGIDKRVEHIEAKLGIEE